MKYYLSFFCIFIGLLNGFAQMKNLTRSELEHLSPKAQQKYFHKIHRFIDRATKINEYISPLHFLNADDSLNFIVRGSSVSESKSTEEAVRILFPHFREAFAKNVQIVSDKIYKAFQKYDYKKINPPSGEKVYQSGTFIRRFKNEGANTVFYDLTAELRDSNWIWTGVVMLFSIAEKENLPELTFLCYMNENKRGFYLTPEDVARGITEFELMNDLFCLMFYLNYNEVSFRRLKPGQLTRFENQDYFNESAVELKFLSTKILGK